MIVDHRDDEKLQELAHGNRLLVDRVKNLLCVLEQSAVFGHVILDVRKLLLQEQTLFVFELARTASGSASRRMATSST